MDDSYKNTQADRLRKARVAAGFETNAEAISRFGWAESTYNSHENGNRTFPLKRAKIYGSAFKVDPYWLLDGSSQDETSNVKPSSHKFVKVIGYVQAGNWGEAHELLPDDQADMFISPNLKYENMYALAVRGDSMNEVFPEGTLLACVDKHYYNKEIKSGDKVVVEAICVEDQRETTVKEFFQDENGKNWLIPRSTNRAHQAYPVPNGEDIDLVVNGKRIKSIEIMAIVKGSYREE